MNMFVGGEIKVYLAHFESNKRFYIENFEFTFLDDGKMKQYIKNIYFIQKVSIKNEIVPL